MPLILATAKTASLKTTDTSTPNPPPKIMNHQQLAPPGVKLIRILANAPEPEK